MRKSLVLILLGLISSFAQEVPKSPDSLRWKHVSSQYRNFDEIKPVLINDGDVSVFLSRLWPDGSAQLERFNETTGVWEYGGWGSRCGVVSHATIPIEISPHTERKIQVYWQLSTDDWDKPKHFIVIESSEKRPLKGKYRFALRYSLKPWTLIQRPGPIYTIVSPEFLVTR